MLMMLVQTWRVVLTPAFVLIGARLLIRSCDINKFAGRRPRTKLKRALIHSQKWFAARCIYDLGKEATVLSSISASCAQIIRSQRVSAEVLTLQISNWEYGVNSNYLLFSNGRLCSFKARMCWRISAVNWSKSSFCNFSPDDWMGIGIKSLLERKPVKNLSCSW